MLLASGTKEVETIQLKIHWKATAMATAAPRMVFGNNIEPDAIHIMKRSEYSGEFGDYSTFSDEMDHISDADYNWEEESNEQSGS